MILKAHTLGLAAFLFLLAVTPAKAQGVQIPNECQDYGLSADNVMNPTLTPLEVLLHYRAPDHRYDNAYGDVALLRYALKAPYGLFWQLTGNGNSLQDLENRIMAAKPCGLALYQLNDRAISEFKFRYQRSASLKELNTIQNLSVSPDRRLALLNALNHHELFFQGYDAPINRAGFVHMVEQVIGENKDMSGIEPQIGTEPVWSARMLWNLRPELLPVLTFPKLLIALTIGESARYLTTGGESPLLAWILSRPYSSIEPYDLLSASYRLNHGNMMDALITIENVLSRHWRIPHRDRLEQTLRLTPITNQFGDDRNLFGTWYHFFGLVLYGYAHSGWEGSVIGHVETVGSQILSRFKDEEGETQVNNVGALVGADIRKVLQSASWQSRYRVFDYSRSAHYLLLHQSFQKQLMNWRPNRQADQLQRQRSILNINSIN